MSLTSGSVSFKRFKILEAPRTYALSDIAAQLNNSKISALEAHDVKDHAVGFCHPFSGEPGISDAHSLVFGQTFVFGFRIDKKRVPPTFLKLQIKYALESMGLITAGDAEEKKIAPKIKAQVRDRIKEELLKMTLPQVKIIEVLWDLSSGDVMFMSTSQSLTDQFTEMFMQATGIRLTPVNAGTMSIDFDRVHLGQNVDLKPLVQMLPESFF